MKIKENLIHIDGSKGEGGGQMLRSSLSLSMLTGQPFKMTHIRANRKKPGLMRQHLTAVKAAAEICAAELEGAELGSQELFFQPQKPKGGEYHFRIGSAGSTSLVAQTVIPALILAEGNSLLTIEGGTHNMQAPPYDFLKYSFLPVLKKMGVEIEASIERYGFYPVGGGKITFKIKPVKKLKPLELVSRGEQKKISAEVCFANLDIDIPKRELKTIAKVMEWPKESLHICQIKNSVGSGNVVLMKLEYDQITEVVTSFGRHGLRAEKVAKNACLEAKKYLSNEAVVSTHLADQILLPMVLAGKGKFTTFAPSLHFYTNIEVIKKFIPCDIRMEEQKTNLWHVEIDRTA